MMQDGDGVGPSSTAGTLGCDESQVGNGVGPSSTAGTLGCDESQVEGRDDAKSTGGTVAGVGSSSSSDSGQPAVNGTTVEEQQDKCEEKQSDKEEEEDSENDTMHLIPSYPFPADFYLEFQGSRIEACRHLCKQHPGGTRAIAIFFPGVHGGVGPCRQPGANFDENALFSTVAGKIANDGYDVDCYRCSWPYMRPLMSYAVGGACRVLHHALLEAMAEVPEGDELRKIDVIFIGHSLGGAVAVQSAEMVARHFGNEGERGKNMQGLERARVRVTGICTLNGAVRCQPKTEDYDLFKALSGIRALLIAGDADQIVPPETTRQLYEALPTQSKKHLVMRDGTHDLFSHKAALIEELTRFITADVQTEGGQGS